MLYVYIYIVLESRNYRTGLKLTRNLLLNLVEKTDDKRRKRKRKRIRIKPSSGDNIDDIRYFKATKFD